MTGLWLVIIAVITIYLVGGFIILPVVAGIIEYVTQEWRQHHGRRPDPRR